MHSPRCPRRGDWPLDNASHSAVEPTRKILFAAAGGLEWLHNAARDNPYENDAIDAIEPKPDEVGSVEIVAVDPPRVEPDPTDEKPEPKPIPIERLDEDIKPDTKPTFAVGKAVWPMPNTLHPLVTNMPESAKSSLDSVGLYIKQHESDPYQRVKALHDFVADRVAYDINTLGHGQQTAQKVFERRTGVCEGYARMLLKLGEITGDEIVYVVGVSRDIGGELSGGGHAWNAARIEGKWYLIDPTWNAGHVENGVFKKQYKTDYLFTPPQVFGVNHFPDRNAWQLVATPLTRGEWMRRPVLNPGFHRTGLELVAPQRSQSSVSGSAEIVMNNREQKHVIAELVEPDTGRKLEKCKVQGTKKLIVNCPLPTSGTYQVRLFASDKRFGQYPFVGQLEFVNRL